MSMNQQVANFGNTVQQMRRFFRGDTNALNSYLSKCILYSGMGSNDYLNNYFMPDFYSSSSDYTPKAFAALLLQDYSRQLSVSCSTFYFLFFIYVYIFEQIRLGYKESKNRKKKCWTPQQQMQNNKCGKYKQIGNRPKIA